MVILGTLPHFYKVFKKAFGPYNNDIKISFNGLVDDSLYVYSGLNPNNPDRVFNDLIVPSGTVFYIDVKNETEPEAFINGSFEFRSINETINFKKIVSDQTKQYYIYSYDLSKPNVKTKVGEYSYLSLPITFQLESTLCYEFGILEEDLSENENEVINLYLTLDDGFPEFSKFTRIPAEYVLLSERIFIDKNNDSSSWYTWNNNNICTIKHNLNGLIDFIIRERGINEIVKIPHKIVDNNTLQIDFNAMFNNGETVLLTDYQTTNKEIKNFTDIIQFQLYNLSKNSNILIYKFIGDGDNYYLEHVETFKYENLPSQYEFDENSHYRIFAQTDAVDLKRLYEIIVWKVDEIQSKWKKNVFTLQKFSKDEVEWAEYENDDPLCCDLPFRFSILGYSKVHEFAGSNVIDNATINTNMAIEPTYQFKLTNDKLKVLVPNFESKEQCHSIYFYISLLSKSINVQFDKNNDYVEWSSFYGADGYELKTVKIKHNMNGIVQVKIQDTRFERYDSYIIDNNTVQLVFVEPWKPQISNINVDFYLIKKCE